MNFSFVTSYSKELLPILEHLEIREPLPSFKGFLKCMGPIAYIFFTRNTKVFRILFYLSCFKKKKHMTRGGVSITLNCLIHELGASLNNISIFPQPKYIS